MSKELKPCMQVICPACKERKKRIAELEQEICERNNIANSLQEDYAARGMEIERLEDENKELRASVEFFQNKLKARNKEIADLEAENERLKELSDDLYFAYINKDSNCPHGFENNAVDKYREIRKPESEE